MEEGENMDIEMGKTGDFPDELRCRRSDGKQWRCKRRIAGEGKMCVYHLFKSNGKGRGERKEGVKVSVKKKKKKMVQTELGEERKEVVLVMEGCSVSGSGQKRNLVKQDLDVEEGVEEDDSLGGSKKKVGNVDALSNKMDEEVMGLVAEGGRLSTSGRKRKPVKRFGDEEEQDGLSRGSRKKEGNVDVLSRNNNVKKDAQVAKRLILGEEMVVPDNLRCTRTDGRRWRCFRQVKDGATLCENHYLQGRLRQVKAVVPESLKLQRRDRLSLFKCSQIQVSKFGSGKKRRPVKWRQWSKFSETLDDTLRKLQLRKSDTELQLLKAYLKKQAEKLEVQQQFASTESYCRKEVTKELPFGSMTISASPALQAASAAGTSCNVKIGLDQDSLSGVSFRSKNIEPVPIGSYKVMPVIKEMVKLKRANMRCHLCNKLGSQLAKCLACKKESFCMECIKERYLTSRDNVEKSCPVCCKQCSCKTCLLTQSKDADHQDCRNDKRNMEKAADARKLIQLLLPALRCIKYQHKIELDLERKNKGKGYPESCKLFVKNNHNEHSNCENGKSGNDNTCVSCKNKNCSCTLCLNCSRNDSEGLTKSVDMMLSNYFDKTMSTRKLSREVIIALPSSSSFKNDDSASCLLKFDGCERSLLVLKRVFTAKWINELEESADKAVSSFCCTDGTDIPSCSDIGHESESFEQLQQASSRKSSRDNFIYYPSINDSQLLNNFHKLWRKHHPIIIRNVLHPTPTLCWDPIFFFCSYLERCHADSPDNAEVEASNYLNWCEVEIGIRQSYVGQLNGWSRANMWDETLKLKGCLSSYLFQNKFPDHYARIVSSLPHKEYMNPMVGKLNLPVYLPPEVKPDLGPFVQISYGIHSESVDSMPMLCYNSYDLIHIMVHATEVVLPSEQVTRVRKLMETKWSEYQEASTRTASNERRPKKKGKLLKDILKVGEKVTTCGGESGESCNSVVMQEPPGRNAPTLNRHRESGSDSEASYLNSDKLNDQIPVPKLGSIETTDNDDSSSVLCGAEWDVFRREDIPALLDYLKNHPCKFSQPSGISQNGVQLVLGRNIFLDSNDILRLKEKFNIEPWTFKQRVGESVVIPSGCPYQIRTLKSCVSIAFNFVSPESAIDSVDLSYDLKLLSGDLLPKEDKLEVKKMVLYTISTALQQLSELNSAG